MGGFIIFNIEMKRVFLDRSIDQRAQGRGSSIAGNWSRYNLCDIVTNTASVAIVALTDPDVHFKCYKSADCKIQATTKHETEVQTIHQSQNMVPFKPVVFIQVHLTNSHLRDNAPINVKPLVGGGGGRWAKEEDLTLQVCPW